MKKRQPVRPCRATKQGCESCQTTALLGSDFCYFHDPLTAAERREAQALGGRQALKLMTAETSSHLFQKRSIRYERGLIDPRVANAVGYLANILIKAFEHDELETRIERLEALLERRSEARETSITVT